MSNKLAISLILAIAQVVIQAGLILEMPVYYAGVPEWMFSVPPLVVFSGSLIMQVVLAKRKSERLENLR